MELNVRIPREPDPKLFSREHVVADDLSRMLGEQKRFGAYLGIAQRYRESDLRSLAKFVLHKDDLPQDARGKYFFACLRKLPILKRRHKKTNQKHHASRAHNRKRINRSTKKKNS